MVFTIEEIKKFLATQNTVKEAIENISEQSITDCIPVDDFSSLNYAKNKENLEKYEEAIGMKKRIDEQLTLQRSTNGKKGRIWLACSPKWIEGDKKDTKYEIHYWVNYGDDMTYGWFTVEQIIQWFDNPKMLLINIGGRRAYQR